MYGCTDVRTDGHVTITSQPNSRIDRLPYFLSNGAPLAGFARRLRYKLVEKTNLQISDKARQSSVGVKQLNKFYVKGPLK